MKKRKIADLTVFQFLNGAIGVNKKQYLKIIEEVFQFLNGAIGVIFLVKKNF